MSNIAANVRFVINVDGIIAGPQIMTKDVPPFATDEIIRLQRNATLEAWLPKQAKCKSLFYLAY